VFTREHAGGSRGVGWVGGGRAGGRETGGGSWVRFVSGCGGEGCGGRERLGGGAEGGVVWEEG